MFARVRLSCAQRVIATVPHAACSLVDGEPAVTPIAAAVAVTPSKPPAPTLEEEAAHAGGGGGGGAGACARGCGGSAQSVVALTSDARAAAVTVKKAHTP
jgi:hypothetical protein